MKTARRRVIGSHRACMARRAFQMRRFVFPDGFGLLDLPPATQVSAALLCDVLASLTQ